MSVRSYPRGRLRRGSEIVEFALASFLLFALIMGVFEISRMVLVYSSIANSAREAVRYAASNGGTKNSPATTTDICAVVTNYITGVNKSALTCLGNNAVGGATGSRIAVSWPDGNTQPGSRVQVTVIYKYDPFFSFLPLKVNLGSTTEAYIMY